jgi:hypothetical protein
LILALSFLLAIAVVFVHQKLGGLAALAVGVVLALPFGAIVAKAVDRRRKGTNAET